MNNIFSIRQSTDQIKGFKFVYLHIKYMLYSLNKFNIQNPIQTNKNDEIIFMNLRHTHNNDLLNVFYTMISV